MPARRIVVIGASAGGIEALRAMLAELPRDFPSPLAVVLHRSRESPRVLEGILQRVTQLEVLNPHDADRIRRGVIYVAPPDHHLVVEPGHFRVTRGPRENRFRPAIDPLFRSAAQVYGPAAIGVVLTGQLDDGSAGLAAIKQMGGVAIVQDPADAAYPSMPRSATAAVDVDYSVPLSEIPRLLLRLVTSEVNAPKEPVVQDPIDIEVRIAKEEHPLAAGLLNIGDPSSFACPECHGVLLQMKEAEPARFRCHTGHAYSIEALAASIEEGIEAALWNAVRGLEEAALLASHLSAHTADLDDAGAARRLAIEAPDLKQQAEALRQILERRGGGPGPDNA